MYGLKPVPFTVRCSRHLQGLKPFRLGGAIGTSKLVPLLQSLPSGAKAHGSLPKELTYGLKPVPFTVRCSRHLQGLKALPSWRRYRHE